MRIAMPVDHKTNEATICISFGRTPYFLVCDTDTNEVTFLDNNAIASQGGAGIKAAQSIVDAKVDVLITPRCGENAAEVLHAGNVEIYKSLNDTAENNIKAFNKGEVGLLEEIHPGFHKH